MKTIDRFSKYILNNPNNIEKHYFLDSLPWLSFFI